VTEKRQLETQLRQSQKMQAIGQLAGGVAHDFNNLLAVIFGHGALLAAAFPLHERLRDSVVEINLAARASRRADPAIIDLQPPTSRRAQGIGVRVGMDESRNLLRRLIGEDVCLAVIPSPGLNRVRIDPGQISQVLMNLAVNARDAMPQGGELTIETRDVDFADATQTVHPEMRPGRYVLLAVTDTGCGMTLEVQAHICEPFFATKSDNTGLGLAVVDGIVKQNGGYVAVASRPGLGTKFNIYLPAVEGTAEGLPPKPLSKPVAGNETILLVEDEDPVREVTALLLESLGYQVLQVSNAEEALNLADNTRAKIDLLFTDVIMPGMSGRELAEAFRVRAPGLKVLFQSGYTDDMVVRHGVLRSEVAFLQKPFTVDALAKKIRDRLDQK
jgi:CheY-like chemotaxis protein